MLKFVSIFMEAMLIQIFKYIGNYEVKIYKNYQRSDRKYCFNFIEPKKVTLTSGEAVL